MAGNKRKAYPATTAEYRHLTANSVNPATEETLASEGRGVQEDALMSGGPMGVEDGTGGASAKGRKPRQY